MFERYTERARRVIFFAYYEASNLSSQWIDTEHLLLGALREDKLLSEKLTRGAIEGIRKQLGAQIPCPIEHSPTSADLPLSHDSRLTLAYCAEEAEQLRHKLIDSGHLVLGLLRTENCTAAAILKQHGIELSSYRNAVSGSQASARPLERSVERPAVPVKAPAPSLISAVAALQKLVDGTIEHLSASSDAYGEERLKGKPWSRKEALGHLIDCASGHQQWIGRALTESKLTAPAYPPDELLFAQQYRDAAWKDVVDRWVVLNRLLIGPITWIPEDKLNTPCRIGIQEPIPLSQLITNYVEHCEDIVGQILA